jgi:hypothetical protein
MNTHPCLRGLLVLLAVSSRSFGGPPSSVPAAATIPLPGGSGGIGFDDLRYSVFLDRVLAPAGRTGNLDLIDPDNHAVTAIGGFAPSRSFGGGHGEGTTSVDEGGGFLYATDRTSETINVIDPRAKKIVGSAKLAAGPDYVRFVPPTRELWVTEPDSDRIEVFRLEEKQPLLPRHDRFIPVKDGPESLVVDPARHRAYTHLWSGTTLAIDLVSHAIVERWPNGCKDSRGIALDADGQILFAACAEGTVSALDVAHGGKVLGRASSGSGVDIVDYDPKIGHLYFPGARSASMAIIGMAKNGSLSVLGTVPTAGGAHCVVTDGKRTAYVCDPKAGALLAIHDPYPASLR